MSENYTENYGDDVIRMKPGPRPGNAADWTRVSALRAEGKTISEVASIVGVHETTIYNGRKKGYFIDPGQVTPYKKRAAKKITGNYSRIEVKPDTGITLKINGVTVSGSPDALKALLGVW